MGQWILEHLTIVIIVACLVLSLPAIFFSAKAEHQKAREDGEYQRWKKEHGLE